MKQEVTATAPRMPNRLAIIGDVQTLEGSPAAQWVGLPNSGALVAGLAADARRPALWLHQSDGWLREFDLVNRTATGRFVAAPTTIAAIQFDPLTGDLYVLESMSPSGQNSVVAPAQPEPEGYLWGGRLAVLRVDSAALETIDLGSNLLFPRDMKFDAARRVLWITDTAHHRLLRLPLSTLLVTEVVDDAFLLPTALDIDPVSGDVWVRAAATSPVDLTDWGWRRRWSLTEVIMRVSADGIVVDTRASHLPFGMREFTSHRNSGTLLVMDSALGVRQLTPDNTLQPVLDTAGTTPTGIAVDPVYGSVLAQLDGSYIGLSNALAPLDAFESVDGGRRAFTCDFGCRHAVWQSQSDGFHIVRKLLRNVGDTETEEISPLAFANPVAAACSAPDQCVYVLCDNGYTLVKTDPSISTILATQTFPEWNWNELLGWHLVQNYRNIVRVAWQDNRVYVAKRGEMAIDYFDLALTNPNYVGENSTTMPLGEPLADFCIDPQDQRYAWVLSTTNHLGRGSIPGGSGYVQIPGDEALGVVADSATGGAWVHSRTSVHRVTAGLTLEFSNTTFQNIVGTAAFSYTSEADPAPQPLPATGSIRYDYLRQNVWWTVSGDCQQTAMINLASDSGRTLPFYCENASSSSSSTEVRVPVQPSSDYDAWFVGAAFLGNTRYGTVDVSIFRRGQNYETAIWSAIPRGGQLQYTAGPTILKGDGSALSVVTVGAMLLTPITNVPLIIMSGAIPLFSYDIESGYLYMSAGAFFYGRWTGTEDWQARALDVDLDTGNAYAQAGGAGLLRIAQADTTNRGVVMEWTTANDIGLPRGLFVEQTTNTLLPISWTTYPSQSGEETVEVDFQVVDKAVFVPDDFTQGVPIASGDPDREVIGGEDGESSTDIEVAEAIDVLVWSERAAGVAGLRISDLDNIPGVISAPTDVIRLPKFTWASQAIARQPLVFIGREGGALESWELANRTLTHVKTLEGEQWANSASVNGIAATAGHPSIYASAGANFVELDLDTWAVTGLQTLPHSAVVGPWASDGVWMAAESAGAVWYLTAGEISSSSESSPSSSSSTTGVTSSESSSGESSSSTEVSFSSSTVSESTFVSFSSSSSSYSSLSESSTSTMISVSSSSSPDESTSTSFGTSESTSSGGISSSAISETSSSSPNEQIAFNWRSIVNTFLTLADGATGVPLGGLMRLGTLGSNSESDMFAMQNYPAMLDSMFTPWASTEVGAGTAVDGTYYVDLSGPKYPFNGQQIYMLVFNTAQSWDATQVGLYANPNWIFELRDPLANYDLADAGLNIVIGDYSEGTCTTPTDINGGNAVRLHEAVP